MNDLEIFDDGGPAAMLHEHIDELPQETYREQDNVPDQLIINIAAFAESAIASFNKHKARYIAIGGTMLGGLGFTAGAKVFNHRTAH